MFQVKELSYGKIIKKISFNLERGKCLSLIGENGCGKSTLLKCIAGIYGNYTGEVLINGVNARNLSKRKLASKVAYVPQIIEKRIELTVNDFLNLSLYPYSPSFAKGEKGREMVKKAVSSFKLRDILSRKICLLSGGEIQKVLIAGALVQGADLLLLDEPTSHLDVYRAESIIKIVESLVKNQGKTVIFVSHNLKHVAKVSDMVIVLKSGEIIDYIERDFSVLENKGFLEKVYG